jgi:hypothetical protein
MKRATLPDAIRTFPALITWIAETHHPNEKHRSRQGEGSKYGIAMKIQCAPALVYRWAQGNIGMPDEAHVQSLAATYQIPYARVMECVIRSLTGRDLYVVEGKAGRRGRGVKVTALAGLLLLGGGLSPSSAAADTPTGADPVTTSYVKNGRRVTPRLADRLRSVATRWGQTRRLMRPLEGAAWPVAA